MEEGQGYNVEVEYNVGPEKKQALGQKLRPGEMFAGLVQNLPKQTPRDSEKGVGDRDLCRWGKRSRRGQKEPVRWWGAKRGK